MNKYLILGLFISFLTGCTVCYFIGYKLGEDSQKISSLSDANKSLTDSKKIVDEKNSEIDKLNNSLYHLSEEYTEKVLSQDKSNKVLLDELKSYEDASVRGRRCFDNGFIYLYNTSLKEAGYEKNNTSS